MKKVLNSCITLWLLFSLIGYASAATDAATQAVANSVAKPAATTQTLRLLSMNVWVSGTNVTNGPTKVLNAILTSGADIVALSEADNDFSAQLAGQLGWFYFGDGDNTILSRFPLGQTWSSGKGSGAEVRIANDKIIAVKATHLTAYPYGPYRACLDEADYTAIYEDEEITSNRLNEITAALNSLTTYLTNGTPTFLLGDLNTPSHLDWTEASAATHCDYAVDWPVTLEIAEAGLLDSYRQIYPDPLAQPGITWSPIYGDWHYGEGKPEPLDRIDFIFYAGNGVELLSSDIFISGQLKLYPYHLLNEWPSDHAAVLAEFNVESGAEVSLAPAAKFFVGSAAVHEGDTVQFSDISTNNPTSWSWTFSGGQPAQSTGQNPAVVYAAEGDYTVSLRVTNASGSDTLVVTELIHVEPVVDPPHLELDKIHYEAGETIWADFTNGPGNPTDWVGIYKVGDTPSAVGSTLWYYVNGTQSAGAGIADGSVAFVNGLSEDGAYWAGFFYNDGYAALDTVAFTVGIVPGVADKKEQQPKTFSLQTSPNPFNAGTKITFFLPQAGMVRLEIFDTLGKKVTTLAQEKMAAGEHSLTFDAGDLASGAYICRLTTGESSISKKILLLK